MQDYCINRLAHERREHFIILCLDNQNRLISEETMSVGTVNQTAVYTREVVNAALQHQAQVVILLHNDPSGEVKPSRADIDVTRDIEKALAVTWMVLHDHPGHCRYHMRQLQKSWAFVSRTAAPVAASFLFDIFRQFTGHLASFTARRQQARTRRV